MKADIVAKAKADLVAGQDAVLESVIGAACDQSALEQKASDGTLTQADLDAAVQPLKDQIAADAQALSDAHAKADSDLASLQSALDAMTSKEKLAEKSVSDVNAAIAQVQSSFDAIKAAFPVPAPVDPVAPAPAV